MHGLFCNSCDTTILSAEQVDGLIDIIEGTLDSMEDWQEDAMEDTLFWIGILEKFDTERSRAIVLELREMIAELDE